MRRLAPLLRFAVGASLIGACSQRSPLLAPTPAEVAAPAPDSFRVAFLTTRGTFLVMAHRDWSPYGVDRFYFLVSHGYYDDTYFFRVVNGFVAQWGISGNPLVDQAWRHQTIPDDPVLRSNQRGMIAFARGGRHTRDAQLFVSYRDNARLDTLNGFGFPPVAQVVAGMDVVDALYHGYGEGPPRGKGPSQDSIAAAGNAYLARGFPLLDRIRSARVTESWRDTVRASMRLDGGNAGGDERRPAPGGD